MKKRIYLIIIIVILIALLIGAFVLVNKNKENALIKEESKDFTKLVNRDSNVINYVDDTYLEKYLNKDGNTLIIFSASWCEYCVNGAKYINEFMNKNPNASVIIVSHDREYEELANYITSNKCNWFIIFDKNTKIREQIDPGSKGIPAIYILDSNGNVLKKDIRIEDLQTIDSNLQVKG